MVKLEEAMANYQSDFNKPSSSLRSSCTTSTADNSSACESTVVSKHELEEIFNQASGGDLGLSQSEHIRSTPVKKSQVLSMDRFNSSFHRKDELGGSMGSFNFNDSKDENWWNSKTSFASSDSKTLTSAESKRESPSSKDSNWWDSKTSCVSNDSTTMASMDSKRESPSSKDIKAKSGKRHDKDKLKMKKKRISSASLDPDVLKAMKQSGHRRMSAAELRELGVDIPSKRGRDREAKGQRSKSRGRRESSSASQVSTAGASKSSSASRARSKSRGRARPFERARSRGRGLRAGSDSNQPNHNKSNDSNNKGRSKSIGRSGSRARSRGRAGRHEAKDRRTDLKKAKSLVSRASDTRERRLPTMASLNLSPSKSKPTNTTKSQKTSSPAKSRRSIESSDDEGNLPPVPMQIVIEPEGEEKARPDFEEIKEQVDVDGNSDEMYLKIKDAGITQEQFRALAKAGLTIAEG